MSHEPERRRHARWRAAAAWVPGHAPALEVECPPGALDRLLPLRAMPQPARCTARLVGRIDGTPIEIVEYEWSASVGGAHEPVRFESLVVVAEHEGIEGDAVIERAVSSHWREEGASPAWVGGRDHRLGIDAFDGAYRVYAETEERARAVLPQAVVRHLVWARFEGVLDVRSGRLLVGLPRARLSPDGVKRGTALLRGILRAYPRRVGGPYRGVTR